MSHHQPRVTNTFLLVWRSWFCYSEKPPQIHPFPMHRGPRCAFSQFLILQNKQNA